MNQISNSGMSPLTFGQKNTTKKQAQHAARISPYGQAASTVGSSRTRHAHSEESRENLSPEEQAFRDKLEERLLYIYNRPNPSLLPKQPNAEKLFLRFYKDVYPQKVAEKKRLQQQLLQKHQELEVARSREEALGPMAKWPGWSGAAVGLGLESALHLSTLGASMLVVPPGTVTALSAAMGKWMGNAASPQKVDRQISDIESDLEDLDVYLSNLKAQKAIVDAHKGKRAEMSHRHSTHRNPFLEANEPESSTRKHRKRPVE